MLVLLINLNSRVGNGSVGARYAQDVGNIKYALAALIHTHTHTHTHFTYADHT